jgi:hypothetical protein
VVVSVPLDHRVAGCANCSEQLAGYGVLLVPVVPRMMSILDFTGERVPRLCAMASPLQRPHVGPVVAAAHRPGLPPAGTRAVSWPIRILNCCSGDGRDVLEVLALRPDAERVTAVLSRPTR